MEFELARLELREVENVVDQRQQMGATAVDVVRIFRILVGHRPEHATADHLGKSEDCIQGRAQLVTHIGEELRLGAIGVIGLAQSGRKLLRQPIGLVSRNRHRRNILADASIS